MLNRILIVALLLVPSLVSASKFPEFSDYIVPVTTKNTVGDIELDLSGIDWRIKDRIEYGAVGGSVNFAGKYYLLQIGCGTECISAWLIDLDSGMIFNSNLKPSVWGGFCFRADSNLLIANPKTNSDYLAIEEALGSPMPARMNTAAYLWDDESFKLLTDSGDVVFESCD